MITTEEISDSGFDKYWDKIAEEAHREPQEIEIRRYELYQRLLEIFETVSNIEDKQKFCFYNDGTVAIDKTNHPLGNRARQFRTPVQCFFPYSDEFENWSHFISAIKAIKQFCITFNVGEFNVLNEKWEAAKERIDAEEKKGLVAYKQTYNDETKKEKFETIGNLIYVVDEYMNQQEVIVKEIEEIGIEKYCEQRGLQPTTFHMIEAVKKVPVYQKLEEVLSLPNFPILALKIRQELNQEDNTAKKILLNNFFEDLPTVKGPGGDTKRSFFYDFIQRHPKDFPFLKKLYFELYGIGHEVAVYIRNVIHREKIRKKTKTEGSC